VALGQEVSTPLHELQQLLLASDLAQRGMAWPNRLQSIRVTSVRCGEVLPDRIIVTRGACLYAHAPRRNCESLETTPCQLLIPLDGEPGSPIDELLPTVDIEGGAGHRRVGHKVDGQRGDV
jgi:hypothetical protein